VKKLNIKNHISTKNKLIEIEKFFKYTNSEKLYTLTDGKGNYTLSKSGEIWWGDKNDKSNLIKEDEVHGNPLKKYGDISNLSIIKYQGKLGVWDLGKFKMILGPYKNMDEVINSIYEEKDLGDKIKYLDFERS
jgi:hypothetical protein